MRWTVELFGGLRAVQGQKVLARFRTQKTASILAFLAYHLHRSHPRELLIEMLWPESDLAAGRQSLSMALTALRQQLEPPGVPAGSIIQATRSTVGLNRDAVSTDVSAFEDALSRARAAGSDAERIALLAEALPLYAGELLPGYYEEWIIPEQQRLEAAFVSAASRLAQLLHESGDLDRAREIAQLALRAAPLAPETQDLASSLQNREPLRQQNSGRSVAGFRPGTASLWLPDGGDASWNAAQSSDAPPNQSGRASRLAAEGVPPAADPRPPTSPPEASVSQPPALPGTPLRSIPRSPWPSGTVTFVYIDGGPQLDEQDRRRIEEEVQRYSGALIGRPTDPVFAAFAHAGSAVTCALRCYSVFAATEEDASGETELSRRAAPAARLRIALDTGDVDLKDRRYQGPAVETVTRLLLAAHPGQVICSEATASVVQRSLDPETWLMDLGQYRLGSPRLPSLLDASGVTRVYQVQFPGGPDEAFPPLKARPHLTGNLPLQFTSFCGREEDLDRLQALLDPRSVSRLATLTGPGGTGKTRLALEAAARLSPSYGGAAWMAPLAELFDPALVPDAILAALDLPSLHGSAPLDQVVDALAGMDAPVLMILDNFEQLPQEAASMVQVLLNRTPRLRCLVTSRRRLGIPGEKELAVDPLPLPPAGEDPGALASCPSVQLFVERAQAVRPAFQLTRGNAAAVADLCRRLEGIPLALELAASRSQLLTPAQLLQQLGRRLDFLASRRAGSSARHRTLRAAIEWSYHLLSPEGQRLFARLAVFRGGWTLEAAAAVCGEAGTGDAGTGEAGTGDAVSSSGEVPNRGEASPEASPLLDRLGELEEGSLIVVEGGEPNFRFRMLETLREFAEEQLSPEDLATLNFRHAAYLVSLAEQAESYLGGATGAEWLSRLDQELDNLRAVLHWSAASDAVCGLRLAAALAEFWQVRGLWDEGRHWTGRYLELAADAPDADRRRTLLAAGGFAGLQGDYDRAEALLTEALAGDPPQAERAVGLRKLAEVAIARGDYPLARDNLQESLTLARARGDLREEALCLFLLGRAASHIGEYEDSESLWEQTLAAARQVEEERLTALCLDCLAGLPGLHSNRRRVRELYEEALSIRQRAGDRWGIAVSMENLGWSAVEEWELARARGLFDEGLSIKRELGDRPGIVRSLQSLSLVAGRMNETDTALELAMSALRAAREIGHRWQISSCLLDLASVLFHRGDLQGASQALEESLAISRDRGMRDRQSQVLRMLGIHAHERGEYGAALRYAEESLAIRREMGNAEGVGQALYHVGCALFALGQRVRAYEVFGESIENARDRADVTGLAYGLEILAAEAQDHGDLGTAALLFGAAAGICASLEVLAPLNTVNYASRRDALQSDADLAAQWDIGAKMALPNLQELALRHCREQAGREQAGRDQAGTDQAGTDQAGTDQAGTDQAGAGGS